MTDKSTPDFEGAEPGGISRRTVTKAMAWAVPAIAVAAPVPAFAGASQGVLRLDGTGCKLPGRSNDNYKGYAFGVDASNPTQTIYYCVTLTSVTLNGESLGAFTVINLADCTNLTSSFCLAPGDNLSQLALLTSDAGNSSNGQLIVTYELRQNVGSCVCSGASTLMTARTGINDAPPINGASCSSFTQAQKNCLATF